MLDYSFEIRLFRSQSASDPSLIGWGSLASNLVPGQLQKELTYYRNFCGGFHVLSSCCTSPNGLHGSYREHEAAPPLLIVRVCQKDEELHASGECFQASPITSVRAMVNTLAYKWIGICSLQI